MKKLLLALLVATPALAAPRMRSFKATATTDTAAYANGDVMGALQVLTGVLPASSGAINLKTLTLVDQGKQDRAVDILFFSKAVTVASADNAAIDVADAQMIDGFVGRVVVAAADYVDVAGSGGATKALDMVLSGETVGSVNLWYLLVCKDVAGCDYVGTTDLVFRLNYFE